MVTEYLEHLYLQQHISRACSCVLVIFGMGVAKADLYLPLIAVAFTGSHDMYFTFYSCSIFCFSRRFQ